MATVLVSFIGIGDLENREYKETNYYFEGEQTPRKTVVFGSALLDYLKSRGEQVARWLIMGTGQSIWSELIKMSSASNLEPDEETLRDFFYEQSYYWATSEGYISQVSQEKLSQWGEVLSKKCGNTEVNCQLVGDATDLDSQNIIFQSLLEVIQKDNQVVFDVTHGLRNQPIVTAFVLMYLRYLRNIKAENIRFYYGARDLNGRVIRLDFCNELLKATEAVAVYEQTGNYEQIGKNLELSPGFNKRLEALIFLDEVNRTNTKIPNALNEEIANKKASFSPLKESLAKRFQHPLHWTSKKSLANQLRHKALFAFERRQYFKAVLILLEAVIVVYGENCGDHEIADNLELHHYRDRAEEDLKRVLNKDERQAFLNLKKLRNAIAHGTDANGSTIEAMKAKDAMNDENALKHIFKEGDELFLKISNGEIGR